MIRLLVFDVDGTLAEAYRLRLMPRVREFFQRMVEDNCHNRIRLAIATNQGGVGLRYQMDQKGQPGASRYPTEASINERIEKLLQQLNLTPADIQVYVSFRYQDRHGVWTPVPPEKAGDLRWMENWRKPSPGMLLQAMADAGVTPAETLFVGDRGEDQAAAVAARCHFMRARDFFNLDWSRCIPVEEIVQDYLEGGSTEDA